MNLTLYLDKYGYKVVSHADADGVFSAVLLKHHYPIEVVFTSDFGDWMDTNIMLDMVPKIDREGLVIDHHKSAYLELEYRPSYHLVSNDYPTTLIIGKDILNLSLEDKHLYWKVICGAWADGYRGIVSKDVLNTYPILFRGWTKKLINLDKISSMVNSSMKIGKYNEVMNIILNAVNPIDLINNDELEDYRVYYRELVDKTYKEAEIYTLKNFIVYVINSDLHMENAISNKAKNYTWKTIITVNIQYNTLSIRGWHGELLIPMKTASIGGHPYYKGGTINEGHDIFDFLRELKTIDV